MNKVRVRIAPSPTGIPHIGNTRTALFNYIFAKHYKGAFILRIEDTDKTREVKGAKEAILEILEWLELRPDETYVQSERLPYYKETSEQLLKKGFARKDEGAVRFIVPPGKTIEWEDGVGNKKISFASDVIEDFVILKSDGFPTYHLASVVDDHHMNITHVIRGDEWISSTPKHILLYQALNWKLPVFVHLPLILGPDKTKLSKRHGAKSALDYKNEGYLKEALLNFLMLLGWTHPDQKEIFSQEEAISLFDLKDINAAGPIFDLQKLAWFNGAYIRQLGVAELASRIKNQESRIKNIDEKLLYKLISLAQTRMNTLQDFYELARHFFEEPKYDTVSEKDKLIVKDLITNLETIQKWHKDEIFTIVKEVMQKHLVRMPVLYKIVTGIDRGLPLPESLELLGKEKTMQRLKKLVS